MGQQCSISSITKTLLQFLVFLILILLLPFISVGVISAILLRTSVKYAAKIFRQDLSKMVTAIGNFLAGDKFQESPMSNVVIVLILEGNINSDKLKETFINNVMKDNSNYPELIQYLVKWAGYHFWKSDRKFNIDNHFRFIDEHVCRKEEDLKYLCQESLGKKWDATSSPWEFIVVNNYTPPHSEISGPHSVVIWRSHHSLADGYSLLYLLTESLMQHKAVVPSADYFSRSFLEKLTLFLKFPIQLLWEISEVLIGAPTKYSFEAPKGSSKVEKIVTDVTPPVPISLIKDVKNHYDVSFAAVQFAALTGAVREYHKKRNMTVPHFYPCLATIPHPGHKLYKLRNHMGAALVYLPTFEDDPHKRLMASHRDYLRVKRSTFAVASFYESSLLGCNVRMVIKWIMNHHFFPFGVSNFPAGAVYSSLLGHKVVDAIPFGGPLEGNSGVGFVLSSYVDGFRISAAARSTVMTKDDVSEITKLFVHHLHQLDTMTKSDQLKTNFENV